MDLGFQGNYRHFGTVSRRFGRDLRRIGFRQVRGSHRLQKALIKEYTLDSNGNHKKI